MNNDSFSVLESDLKVVLDTILINSHYDNAVTKRMFLCVSFSSHKKKAWLKRYLKNSISHPRISLLPALIQNSMPAVNKRVTHRGQ